MRGDSWWEEVSLEHPYEVIAAIAHEGVRRSICEKNAERFSTEGKLCELLSPEAQKAYADLEGAINHEQNQVVEYASRLGFALATVMQPQSLLGSDFETLLQEAATAAGLRA